MRNQHRVPGPPVMGWTRLAAAVAVMLVPLAAACDDDAPSTNTITPPPAATVGGGSGPPTGSVEGNVGDFTGVTPVAGGDDSVIQGNQPMQTFAVD